MRKTEVTCLRFWTGRHSKSVYNHTLGKIVKRILGNPLIDIATIIGENMNTEDRRSFTPDILELYNDEIEKRKGGFKKRFDMTLKKVTSPLRSL